VQMWKEAAEDLYCRKLLWIFVVKNERVTEVESVMAFWVKMFQVAWSLEIDGTRLEFARDQEIMEFDRIYERPFAKQT